MQPCGPLGTNTGHSVSDGTGPANISFLMAHSYVCSHLNIWTSQTGSSPDVSNLKLVLIAGLIDV